MENKPMIDTQRESAKGETAGETTTVASMCPMCGKPIPSVGYRIYLGGTPYHYDCAKGIAFTGQAEADRQTISGLRAEVDRLRGEPERYWEARWRDEAKEAETLRATQAELVEVSDKIGFWLAAALDDQKVCKEMKADIEALFTVLAKLRGG